MKILHNIIGGLAGAAALNIVHEIMKRSCSIAPRIDKVGEEAMAGAIELAGHNAPEGKKLTAVTLASDIVLNAAFYSLIGAGKESNLVPRGAVYGLAAGLSTVGGASVAPLNDEPVTKTTTTKIMTVSWYVIGGIVAGAMINGLRRHY